MYYGPAQVSGETITMTIMNYSEKKNACLHDNVSPCHNDLYVVRCSLLN